MRLLVPAVIVLAACNSTQTRTVQGRLTGTASAAVVFSESASGEQTATQAGPDGTFTIAIPTDTTVTLLVGRVNGATNVWVERHIGPPRFRVPPGPTIRLGTVRPEGAPREQLEPVSTMAPQMCPAIGEADLPYDAKLALGQTWRLAEAFAEKGPQPTRVVTVEMDGSTWRLAELRSGAAFTVTQADCDHVGNRDVGRDRAVITWENADGSTETDHLDLRYCETDGSGGASGHGEAPDDDDDHCAHVEHEGCGDHGSTCDDDSELEPVEGGASCPATTGVPAAN